MKHQKDKPFFRVLALLVYILFTQANISFSQADTSFASIKHALLTISDPVIKTTFSQPATCNLPVGMAVEELLATALAYNKHGNWQCCEKILHTLGEKEGNLAALQLCHFHLALATYHTFHQNYDSAYRYAALVSKVAEEHKWKNEKAEELLLLSAVDLKQRNISFAYAYADSALNLSRQTGNENLEGRTLFQLALCARRHFTAIANRSLPFFFMAREKAIATADSVTLASIDLYLISDYFELKKWASGLPYFKEAIPIAMHSNDFYLLYIAYTACGYTFEVTENFSEALVLFTKALQLSQFEKQPYNIQHCYHDMARCYEGLHVYDSALAYANLAATVPGVDTFYANVWDTKAAIYNDMGEYEMATAMYKRSVDWFREDFLYRNQDQLSGYEAKLNTKEKEIQVTQQKKRAIQLEWMVGAIGGLLIISGWAFAVQRRARRKLFLQNTLIQRQQTTLEKALNEKELLLAEIHHRVKNNLSVICSLLELQSNGINDEAAKAAIAVGQNRVSSIALIHQRLYQHENLAAIELGGFLNDLSRQVSSIFKKPNTEIKVEIDVAETLLDIDTAVPLGLIMNELLTNSYKYAFDESINGTIRIDLQQECPGNFLLSYSDNGPGIGDEINIQRASSLGLRLIHRLSKQIGGSATYEYKQGSTFIINFKNANNRNQE